MKTLKQKHEDFIAKFKANGGKTLTFVAPCCGQQIEDRAGNDGETWDTLATCPHCGVLYTKGLGRHKPAEAHPDGSAITAAHEIVGSIPVESA